LHNIMPSWVSHLFIQTMAGTLGGFSTVIITNPLDIVRARLQVQRLESMRQAFKDLWVEEGLRMFSKGLSARLIQSATFSFSIILGYETIKRVSVNDEYKKYVRW
jgi:solute carrier family 25 protein 44